MSGYHNDDYRDDGPDPSDYGDGGEACGPDCVGTTCCRSAASAARAFCGCGGGVDHSDCPAVEEDEDDDEEETP